jgi:hypothetical protein
MHKQTSTQSKKKNLDYNRAQEYSAKLSSGKLTLCTVGCVSQGTPSLRIGTEGNRNV